MKRRLFAMLVGLCLGIAMTAYAAEEPAPAAAAPAAAAAAPEVKYGIAPGENIRPVTLEAIDGSKKVELDKLQGKTIFMLISSVCSACRTEIQEVSDNLAKFKGKADIYGVLIDMDPKGAASKIGNVPFPLLADPEYKVGMATNLMSAPSTIVVQAGKIVYSKSGYRPGQWKEYLK